MIIFVKVRQKHSTFQRFPFKVYFTVSPFYFNFSFIKYFVQFICIWSLSSRYILGGTEHEDIKKSPISWSFEKEYDFFFEKIIHWLFVGLLIPLFWIIGDISSGFQNKSGQPYSHLVEASLLYIPWHSPLVQHLLISWMPASWLGAFPYICVSAEIGCRIRSEDLLPSSYCE